MINNKLISLSAFIFICGNGVIPAVSAYHITAIVVTLGYNFLFAVGKRYSKMVVFRLQLKGERILVIAQQRPDKGVG